MNDWQTSSWSITPMGGGGALRHATSLFVQHNILNEAQVRTTA